jgi:tRNA1(Val) A37 N6-methylase TrmN6
MSIYNTKLSDIKQRFDVSKEDKLYYGEIYSPFSLIDAMLNLFDNNVFQDPTKKWLDIGAGLGYFSIFLFYKLNNGLSEKIPNEIERKTHIIQEMIYMVEIKEDNIDELKKTFGEKANIIHTDFINHTNNLIHIGNHTFDYIIGNPPYNSKGIKKVPTNTTSSKKNEGQTVWTKFIIKSLSLLTPLVGKMCLIIPSIWLKKDKEGMHQLLTYYKIDKLHCLNSTQTNILFNGNAQTPTCYFILTKKPSNGIIQIFDKKQKAYVLYPHKIGKSIPLFGSHIVTKLQKWVTGENGVGSLKVFKTNMPSVHSKFTEQSYSPDYPYTNIKTCLLERLQPVLIMNYSNIPQPFHNMKKLILAHKMYGFPYFDSKGHYGISNRDNYVITDKTDEEFKQLQHFLSSKLALYLFESARYRMKYLEKYAFEFIPDITQLPNFPLASTMNEETIAEYFELDEDDRLHIQELHRKEYKMFN